MEAAAIEAAKASTVLIAFHLQREFPDRARRVKITASNGAPVRCQQAVEKLRFSPIKQWLFLYPYARIFQ